MDDFFKSMMHTFDDHLGAQRLQSTDTGYVIEVPVPGMSKKDVKVSIKNGMIHINAECENRKYQHIQTLPDDVKIKSMKVNVEKGLLSVRFEKKIIKNNVVSRYELASTLTKRKNTPSVRR